MKIVGAPRNSISVIQRARASKQYAGDRLFVDTLGLPPARLLPVTISSESLSAALRAAGLPDFSWARMPASDEHEQKEQELMRAPAEPQYPLDLSDRQYRKYQRRTNDLDLL